MPPQEPRYNPADEKQLMSELWDPALNEDLLAWVRFVYPWGKENTPLHDKKGPRSWQCEDLEEMTECIKSNKMRQAIDLMPIVHRKATASGRGPGKSAEVSWLEHWNRSAHIGSTTIITANTEPQLKNKTFAEITRWNAMAINAHWWEPSVLSVKPAEWYKVALVEQLKIDCGYYYTQGQLWSEENPDAFAGAHNQYGMMLLMDEASGIPNSIFDVASGFFTDPILHRYWMIFSNARRNSGAFFDAFHTNAAFWKHRNLDSRFVDDIDQSYLDEIISLHGMDSDMVRVEVLGQFPKAGIKQFIANTVVWGAQKRDTIMDRGAALIMGGDVARYGDDWNVVRFRQGRNGRVHPPIRWQGTDTVESAERMAGIINEFKPDAVNIDAGQGTGIIDILRSKRFRVNEVWFGSASTEKEYANKRVQMYAEVKKWLPGACLDHDPRLFTDLTGVDYDYFGKAKDQIILQSKDVFKKNFGRSPDDGDALALTFAGSVARRDGKTSRGQKREVIAEGVDESVFT